jgi:hypothetical protein
MARRNRLVVTRSHYISLIENGADDERLKDQHLLQYASDIRLALDGALHESEPASTEELFAVVTSIVALIGQRMSPDSKQEYIAAVMREFDDLPATTVLPLLHAARRCVTDERQLVKWVAEAADPKAFKLALEVERLQRLARLASEMEG